MTTPQDLMALLSRALDQTGTAIVGVRPEQATSPTPCRSWDVRALVNHVVDEVHQFAVVTGGGERNPLGIDVIGDDWGGAYCTAAAELLAVWRRPGALDRAQRLSFGEVPAPWAVRRQITELGIHAWDISKATGQPTDLDPEVGEVALQWLEDNLKPQMRGDEADGHQIGPELPVPDGAPLYDRIAAFAGRDPR
ncbi:TIGR03086 family metal-binding protein [Actinomadura scrupuli]|uniref:TIGR03086 family metal-binding protein n=1 Tax=Actinomadura scrupuli TaxID=559629 RepID=UPI003D955763